MSLPHPEGGSFRDPAGRVWRAGARIYRSVAPRGAADYEFVRSTGLLDRWSGEGRVVAAQEVDPGVLGAAGAGAAYVLEHPKVPFVSHPYEWSFVQLQAAACLQLDLHLEALRDGVSLSDASAYNVQFQGARPLFIDVLSFRRYRDGEPWLGHRQFCEQFLNPLLLRALLGLTPNAWFRGSPEGIPAGDLARLLTWRHLLSFNTLSHVWLQARLQVRARASSQTQLETLKRRPLPRRSLEGLLEQMRRWVARLSVRDRQPSLWSDYAASHGYAGAEEADKRAFVADFVARTRPSMLWDFGCNTGDYAALALAEGAGYVVGFDADHGALDAAYRRADQGGLAFLPLHMDAANPSPDQGWDHRERRGLAARGPADAVLALAFVHHLALGRNVPVDETLRWLIGLAPRGVIEFVRKDDPTVRRMLALREDVFDGYDESAFAAAVGRRARIVREEEISSTGRRLYWYDRT